MRNGTRKEKYFSTYVPTRKVSEMELQWTTYYWIHTEVHFAAHLIHNHPRPWKMERGKIKNTKNGTTMEKSTLNSYVSVHCSSSKPQPTEAMRIVTWKKKYFSTFQLSMPQKVLEMKLQWTTRHWIQYRSIHRSISNLLPPQMYIVEEREQ